MIQRIQTIYLFLAFIFLLLLIFTPLSIPTDLVNLNGNYILLALTVLGMIDAMAAVFLFKNRKLQLSITRLLGIMLLVLTALVFYFAYTSGVLASFSAFNPEWIFAPGAWIMTLLAQRGITNDIKLLRSVDRLR